MTDAPRTVAQALDFAQAEHQAETMDWAGYCQRFVRMSYGLPTLFGSAKAQWYGADNDDRHPGGRIEDAPVGSGLVFSGGTYWHIELAAHPLGDQVRAWSNDLVTTGDIDIVDRSLATTKWGYPFVGYLSAINDFDLQLDTGKPAKPRQDKHYLRIRAAIEKLEGARDNAKRLGERRDVRIFNSEIRDLEELYAELRHA